MTSNQKHLRDLLITAQECTQAIEQLSNNQSPRLDGFTVEIYKHYWEELKNSKEVHHL